MARLLWSLGSWCARHGLVVIAIWALLGIGVAAAVSTFGAQTNNDLSLPGTDSQAAKDLLADRFPPQQNGVNPIVFDVSTGKLTDADAKQAVSRSVTAIAAVPHVASVTDPVSSDGQTAGLLSEDGQTAFAPVLLDIGSGDLTPELAQQVVDATAPATAAGITVAAGGSVGSTLSTDDSEISEVVGIVAAMIILTLVLGSLVAMGLPIITAVVGLAVALGVVGLLGHAVAIPSSGPTLATMIGLGVGIDYALFLITRHQEHLRDGLSTVESAAQAVATSGSAIVFAGCTVVIALLSLGVAGIPLVSALGLASAIAVVAAVLVAITLLPAFLGLLGHRIAWLSLPAFMRPRSSHRGGLWARWAGVVRRHPAVVAVLSLAALVPLVIPALSLELGQEDVGATAPETTERQAYDLVTDGFGVGYNGPLQVASALDPVAAPSAAYTRKYDKAQSLKADLQKKQKDLTAQKKQLQRQQQQLEAQQQSLEDQQAGLESEQASLEGQADQLQAEQAGLERQAAGLEAEKRRLEAEQARLKAQASALERRARGSPSGSGPWPASSPGSVFASACSSVVSRAQRATRSGSRGCAPGWPGSASARSRRTHGCAPSPRRPGGSRSRPGGCGPRQPGSSSRPTRCSVAPTTSSGRRPRWSSRPRSSSARATSSSSRRTRCVGRAMSCSSRRRRCSSRPTTSRRSRSRPSRSRPRPRSSSSSSPTWSPRPVATRAAPTRVW